MSNVEALQRRSFGETSRKDLWWLQPALVFGTLTLFIIYGTWAAFQAENYFYHEEGAHYLSPFYSPLLYGAEDEPRWVDAVKPSWWPGWLVFSPALLILLGPLGMRATCYYYRGAYYKAFWADPPACAVGEPRTGYRGENKLPLILQNVHRYFFYIAIFFVVVLSYDAIRAFWYTAEDGSLEFGIGVGAVVLLMNAILLGGYTFGCHCSRHLFGGYLNRFAKKPIRKTCYDCVSSLNRRHMLWAWSSLVWVAFSDVYVRLCSMGIWSDWRIL